MDFREKRQFKIFLLLRSGLLRAHEALVPLLLRTNGASVAPSSHILDSNDVLFHWVDIANFFIITGSGG